MRHAYIEPSAWVKRYYREAGTDLTNYLFAELLRPHLSRLLCSRAGMTEVVSVLNRHRNAGRVTQSLFNTAYAHFEAESRRVRLLSVRNYQLDASVRLVSMKMRVPSGTASRDLLSILCLGNELLNPGMCPEGESRKGIIHNAAGLLEMAYGGPFKVRPCRLFDALLIFG